MLFIIYFSTGTKLDLRSDSTQGGEAAVVTLAETKKLKSKIKAVALVECSAKSGENLPDVFVAAVRAATKTKPNKQRTCVVL